MPRSRDKKIGFCNKDLQFLFMEATLLRTRSLESFNQQIEVQLVAINIEYQYQPIYTLFLFPHALSLNRWTIFLNKIFSMIFYLIKGGFMIYCSIISHVPMFLAMLVTFVVDAIAFICIGLAVEMAILKVLAVVKVNLNSRQQSNELSFCNKLWLSNPYIFATQCRRP